MTSKSEIKFLKELFTKDEEKREHNGDIAQVLLLAYEHLQKSAKVIEKDENLKHLATEMIAVSEIVKQNRVLLTEAKFINQVFTEIGPSVFQRVANALRGKSNNPVDPYGKTIPDSPVPATRASDTPLFSGSARKKNITPQDKETAAAYTRRVNSPANKAWFATGHFQSGHSKLIKGLELIRNGIGVFSSKPGDTNQDEKTELLNHTKAVASAAEAVYWIKQGLESIAQGYDSISDIYKKLAVSKPNEAQFYNQSAANYLALAKKAIAIVGPQKTAYQPQNTPAATPQLPT